MTVTVSRLYDSYADAQRAVSSLEAAGIPHSDISIVANNSDDWYGQRGWTKEGIVKTMTRIDVPARNATLPPGDHRIATDRQRGLLRWVV